MISSLEIFLALLITHGSIAINLDSSPITHCICHSLGIVKFIKQFIYVSYDIICILHAFLASASLKSDLLWLAMNDLYTCTKRVCACNYIITAKNFDFDFFFFQVLFIF